MLTQFNILAWGAQGQVSAQVLLANYSNPLYYLSMGYTWTASKKRSACTLLFVTHNEIAYYFNFTLYSTSNLNFDNSILFYLANFLFYSILYFLFFILFYLAVQYSIMLYSVFYSIMYSILFYLARYSILFYFVFYSVNSIMKTPKFCEYFLTS